MSGLGVNFRIAVAVGCEVDVEPGMINFVDVEAGSVERIAAPGVDIELRQPGTESTRAAGCNVLPN